MTDVSVESGQAESHDPRGGDARAAWQELAVRAQRSYMTDPEFHAMVTMIVQEKLAKAEPHIVGGYFLAMFEGEPWLFEAYAGSATPGREEPPSSEPLAPVGELAGFIGQHHKSLAAMQREVVNFEHSKGWQPNDNTFGDSLALLHSEISEMLEAFREIGFEKRDVDMCSGNHPNGTGHSPTVRFPDCPPYKPDDVASEVADVLIRLLSTFAQFIAPHGFDLEAEFERKMAYNRTRSQRHGGKAL